MEMVVWVVWVLVAVVENQLADNDEG